MDSVGWGLGLMGLAVGHVGAWLQGPNWGVLGRVQSCRVSVPVRPLVRRGFELYVGVGIN